MFKEAKVLGKGRMVTIRRLELFGKFHKALKSSWQQYYQWWLVTFHSMFKEFSYFLPKNDIMFNLQNQYFHFRLSLVTGNHWQDCLISNFISCKKYFANSVPGLGSQSLHCFHTALGALSDCIIFHWKFKFWGKREHFEKITFVHCLTIYTVVVATP